MNALNYSFMRGGYLQALTFTVRFIVFYQGEPANSFDRMMCDIYVNDRNLRENFLSEERTSVSGKWHFIQCKKRAGSDQG